MSESIKPESDHWTDPDDEYEEWTEERFRAAAIYENGKLVRPATGTWTNPGGRPRAANPKQQVTLRLDPDILEKFKATGKGWQTRINDTLRKALGI